MGTSVLGKYFRSSRSVELCIIDVLQHISVSSWGCRGVLSPVHNCPGLIFKVSQQERASKIIQLEIWIGVITSRTWLLKFIED